MYDVVEFFVVGEDCIVVVVVFQWFCGEEVCCGDWCERVDLLIVEIVVEVLCCIGYENEVVFFCDFMQRCIVGW